MFRTHKTVTLALIAFAFMAPGCDEDVDLAAEEVEIDQEDMSAPSPDADLDEDEGEPEELVQDLLDDRTSVMPPPLEATCQGWPTGDWCLAQCAGGPLVVLGHWTVIDYGKCTPAGIDFCGKKGLAHSCWGKP